MRVAAELPVLIEGCSHTRDVIGAFVRLVHRPKDRGCGWYQMCPKVQVVGSELAQALTSPREDEISEVTDEQGSDRRSAAAAVTVAIVLTGVN